MSKLRVGIRLRKQMKFCSELNVRHCGRREFSRACVFNIICLYYRDNFKQSVNNNRCNSIAHWHTCYVSLCPGDQVRFRNSRYSKQESYWKFPRFIGLPLLICFMDSARSYEILSVRSDTFSRSNKDRIYKYDITCECTRRFTGGYLRQRCSLIYAFEFLRPRNTRARIALVYRAQRIPRRHVRCTDFLNYKYKTIYWRIKKACKLKSSANR